MAFKGRKPLHQSADNLSRGCGLNTSQSMEAISAFAVICSYVGCWFAPGPVSLSSSRISPPL
eukprot:2474347-Rhodomonas_salina.3